MLPQLLLPLLLIFSSGPYFVFNPKKKIKFQASTYARVQEAKSVRIIFWVNCFEVGRAMIG